VVWVNSTNLFDAAAGFGGYRESGFGREGGREGMYEYLVPTWKRATAIARASGAATAPARAGDDDDAFALPALDRTPKLHIGGTQVRPDSGYTRAILAPDGTRLGEVGEGNRKDLRNAVTAALAATGWAKTSGHARAQVLYYAAENLAARAGEFAARLDAMSGRTDGAREVEASIARLFTYAAWADKHDGAVHAVPIRGVALQMNEPVGVIGIACPDEAPLLGFLSLVAPAIAMGNAVVAVPSERSPLAVTDFYQVLDTSDVPGGVVNIVTGPRDELAKTLAQHDEVGAMWYIGGDAGIAMVERESAGNMKRTWCEPAGMRDWFSPVQGEGREFLRHATQVKNIWIPYGE
nr:aldehyde dehydrogenase family protein [Gemmatimonadaceae bacterium]